MSLIGGRQREIALFVGDTGIAIDMDPQGNLTSALGADAMGEGFADLIHSNRTLADVITPPGRELSAVGQALITPPGGERVLARALAALDADYDVINIDTPRVLAVSPLTVSPRQAT